MRINDPQTAAFGLRAGRRVVVWKGSATAPFMVANKLGVAIDSVRELPQRLKSVTTAEYAEYKTAVMSIKDKLNEGYFFKKALAAALSVEQ